MNIARLRLVPILVALVVARLVAQDTHGDANAEKMQARIDIARQYLVEAGMQAPDHLDAIHAAELRRVIDSWIEQQEAPSGKQVAGADVAGAKLAVSLPTPEAASKTTVPDQSILKELYPSPMGRVGRLVQFKAQSVEQPKTVSVAFPKGTRSPCGLSTCPTLNPDHVLWQYSAVLTFSELSLLPSDLASIYGAYKQGEEGGTLSAQNGGPCSLKIDQAKAKVPPPNVQKAEAQDTDNELVDCLRRVRRRDFFWRGVAGVTATASIGRNPRFVQNTIIPELSFENGKERAFSGEVDFDPKSLFPNGSDWKSVQSALTGFPKSVSDAVLVEAANKICGKPPRKDCLRRLSGPTGAWGFVSTLVPTFVFKVNSQFDFIKNTGGEFIPSPFPESHLWNMSFTTDLRKTISSIKSRTDAASVSALNKVVNAADVNPPDLGQICNEIHLPSVPAGSLFYYALPDVGVKWSFDIADHGGACDKYLSAHHHCTMNGIGLNRDGTLIGYLKHSGPLYLTVADVGGNTKQCERSLVVKGTVPTMGRELLLDYLEIAVSPEVVLDDLWFNNFLQVVHHTLITSNAYGSPAE